MSDRKKAGAKPDAPADLYMAAEQRAAKSSSKNQRTSESSSSAVLDLKEAAKMLHCHPKTLRLMAQANKIPARRIGKLWRFSEQTLREWMEAS